MEYDQEEESSENSNANNNVNSALDSEKEAEDDEQEQEQMLPIADVEIGEAKRELYELANLKEKLFHSDNDEINEMFINFSENNGINPNDVEYHYTSPQNMNKYKQHRKYIKEKRKQMLENMNKKLIN